MTTETASRLGDASLYVALALNVGVVVQDCARGNFTGGALQALALVALTFLQWFRTTLVANHVELLARYHAERLFAEDMLSKIRDADGATTIVERPH